MCYGSEWLPMLPLQVVTHSQRFASLSQTVLRLDQGQVAYIGASSEDPFRLWGPEPGGAQVFSPPPRSMLSCYHVLYLSVIS